MRCAVPRRLVSFFSHRLLDIIALAIDGSMTRRTPPIRANCQYPDFNVRRIEITSPNDGLLAPTKFRKLLAFNAKVRLV